MRKILVSIGLAFALLPAAAQIGNEDPTRFAPATGEVIARLTRGAEPARAEGAGALVAQQTTACRKLGGTPKAPVCGGTCKAGGQCEIAFRGTSAYCACQ